MKFYESWALKMRGNLGNERAQALTAEALRTAGLSSLQSPTDVVLFANALARHGGLVEAMARSLKIQAILRGGVDPLAAA